MTKEQCDSCIYKTEQCYGFAMEKLFPVYGELECADHVSEFEKRVNQHGVKND